MDFVQKGRGARACKAKRRGRNVRFIGKVDRRLDQRRDLDQGRAPTLVQIGKHPARLRQSLPALGLGFRIDQVGEALDFDQIYFAVLEGAAREFARFRHPASWQQGQSLQHRRDDRPAAMDLELGDILPVSLRGPAK